MIRLAKVFLIFLCATHVIYAQASDKAAPQLPSWQVLEFEEKAFWATAKSRLEILPAAGDSGHWELDVQSSVVNNSERVQIDFDPATGQIYTRSRLSEGKEKRLKSYQYDDDFFTRERRNPGADKSLPAKEWPVTSRNELVYPKSATDMVVTSPYLLVLLAQQLQAQGPGKSLEVLVHTDLNFYRVHLTSGNSVPIDVDYTVAGEGPVTGTHETMAVAVQATPELTGEDKGDFALLGLDGDIILFFDRNSGVPVQIRGQAPRIGATEINLKSVTMRDATQ